MKLPDGYKDSLTGTIPFDWECVTVFDECDILDSRRVPLSAAQRQSMKGEIPYYGANGVVDHIDDYLFNQPLVCLAEDGGNFQDFATRSIAYKIEGKSWVNNHAHVLSMRNGQIDFLLYSFEHKDITNFINGGTREKLNKSALEKIPFAFPPLPEQKKIARILSSVDSKLALIDQQITTTQTLKKGLMQKLFTQGVGTQDADGRWQPHTEFQKTELGRIPLGWAVTKLDDLVTRGSGHTPDKQHPEYWNGGIKWVSLADSARLDQGVITITDKEISHLGIDNSSAVLHPKGTVVMSRDAGIGKSAVMGEDMAVSQHFIAWSCEQKGKLNNWFLYYLLQLMKPEFERIAIGSTIKTIGLPYFKKLKIAHPTEIAEQNEIARILSTVDHKLEHLKSKIAQTQQLKKGLMQKLLTGQIRVQPDPQDI